MSGEKSSIIPWGIRSRMGASTGSVSWCTTLSA